MTAVTESLKQAAEGSGTLLVPVLAAVLGARGAIAAAGAATAVLALAAWSRLSRVDSAAGRRVARIELIRRVPLLAALRVVELETVAAALTPRRIAPEQEVIREGDRDARTFYVIESGTAEVLAGGDLLRTLGSGESFGEIALLHGIQRTATVRARTALGLLELDRSEFVWALTGSEHSGLVRRPPSPDTDLASGSLHNALHGVPWIARLGSTVVRQLADRARRGELAAGETLWEQGAPGDTMGIVLAGEVTVEQGGNVEGSVGPGGWVGEVALLHDVPRTATVRAITPVILCEVRRADVLEALEMEGHPPARIVEQLA
jgi:CRP-like cAMP-binding protein